MKEDILRLRALGYTYNQIRDELGCSKGTIAYHLGEGQKEKTRSRTRDIRAGNALKIRQIKEESGCVDCGEKYPHFMLEFDHLPGHEKLGNPVSLGRKYSWQKALEEIAKCEIVCANCHKIRSYVRGQTQHKDLTEPLESGIIEI